MQIELLEIRDHLQRFAPFDTLPQASLDAIAQRVEVGYFKAGAISSRRERSFRTCTTCAAGQ